MTNMTRDERFERVGAIRQFVQDQKQEFEGSEMPPEAAKRVRNAEEELTRHRTVLDQLEARDDKIREMARTDAAHESGDGRRVNDDHSDEQSDTRDRRPNGHLRGKALRAIDQLERMPDAAREYATKEIEQDRDIEQRLARVTVALADPDYFRAFSKWHNDPLTGMHLWTPREREAVAHVKVLERSFGLGAQGGGFLVPYELDPAVIMANVGSVDPMRSVARVTTSAYNVKSL